MIQQFEEREFDRIFEIMEESFPEDEHRPCEEQKALLLEPEYKIYVVKEGSEGQIQAFAAVWELEDYTFIEHLAVTPYGRNAGMGTRMLGELQKISPGRLCLEVELPETELAARRIAFYERNHFTLNAYPYMQPPISRGRKPVPLRIMTTEGGISRDEFESLRDTLYRRVYRCL